MHLYSPPLPGPVPQGPEIGLTFNIQRDKDSCAYQQKAALLTSMVAPENALPVAGPVGGHVAEKDGVAKEVTPKADKSDINFFMFILKFLSSRRYRIFIFGLILYLWRTSVSTL